MRRARAMSTLVLAVTVSCNDVTEPAEFLAGRYELQHIDARTLPTMLPCGALTVTSSTLHLSADGRAMVTRRFLRRGTDSAVVTFEGIGYHVGNADAVSIDVQGRWSHLPEQVRERVRYERHGRELRRPGVGAECDASSTETYALVTE